MKTNTIQKSTIKNQQSQSGVTLLLAVLILSGLVLVTLAVAGFTIQEIRASRSVIASEPAINAAETGAELAIWGLKRSGNSSIPNCSVSAITQDLTSSNSELNYCKAYTDNTYSVVGTASTIFFLYDPDNINGDIDLLGYPYAYVFLTNKSETASVNVNVTRLDGAFVASATINHGDNLSIPIPPVTANSEGRIQVTLSMLSSSATALVNATTDKGLPDALNLSSSGCSSKSTAGSCTAIGQELFTRKIEVNLHPSN